MIISILGCVRVCIADDGYVELIDDARLCDEGCGVVSGADDANAHGAVNLGEELVVDHGGFPRVMVLRLREPVRRRLRGFLRVGRRMIRGLSLSCRCCRCIR